MGDQILRAALASVGFHISDDVYNDSLGLSQPQIIRQLLDTDWRKKPICKASFPDDISSSDGCLGRALVTQIVSVSNIGQPSHAQFENISPSTLLLKLTDGHTKATALCLDTISQLSTNIHPGSKLLLRVGTKYVSGKIILTELNCAVLGGTVQALVDTWKANRYALNMRKLKGSASMAGSNPPVFDFHLSKEVSKSIIPSEVASVVAGGTHKEPKKLSSKKEYLSKDHLISPCMSEPPIDLRQREHDSESQDDGVSLHRDQIKSRVVRGSGDIKTPAAAEVHKRKVKSSTSEKINVYSDKRPSDGNVPVTHRRDGNGSKPPDMNAQGVKDKNRHMNSHSGDNGELQQDSAILATMARECSISGQVIPLVQDLTDLVPPSLPSSGSSRSQASGNIPLSVPNEIKAWPELGPPTPQVYAPLSAGSSSSTGNKSIAAKISAAVDPRVNPAGVRPITAAEGVNLMDFVKKRGRLKENTRSSRTIMATDSNATWDCLACTFCNHAELFFCEICGTKR